MAFSTGYLDDPSKVGAGELGAGPYIALSTGTFEDGLKIGRFCKLDTGSIDNLDGSDTPTIAGVVLRNAAGPVEDAGTIDGDLYGQVQYIRQGLVTVDVKDDETPAAFGSVYVDADTGEATATNTDLETSAEFIEEITDGVWLINVNLVACGLSGSISTLNTEMDAVQSLVPAAITDPGDEGAIAVTASGVCALTTSDTAETRTVAIPTQVGQDLTLVLDVDGGGAATVTVAAAINQTGNNTITFDDAGDTVALRAVQVAGALVWRMLVNDGATLTTV
jgi:hypothetical protein